MNDSPEETTQILRHFIATQPAPRCSACAHYWEMHRSGDNAGCDGSPSARHDEPLCFCSGYEPITEAWFVTRAREIVGGLLPAWMRDDPGSGHDPNEGDPGYEAAQAEAEAQHDLAANR